MDWFNRTARGVAARAGHPLAFALAVTMIVVWGITGPLFGFGDTWQLVINTATTIITFLMVFLIQNTQNRDTAALHLKLDELLHVISKADDALIEVEEAGDAEIARKRSEFKTIARAAASEGIGH